MVDNEYEARKQAQIETSYEQARKRLEEIDKIVEMRIKIGISTDYVKFMDNLKAYELDSYLMHIESRLAILRAEIERRKNG